MAAKQDSRRPPPSAISRGEEASGTNDTVLWNQLKRGEARALEVLFRSHYQALFDYGLRLGLECERVKDGIQEIFASIWQKRTSLSEVESPKSYLLVCLRRQLMQQIQKERRHAQTEKEYVADVGRTAFSAEDLVIFAELDLSRQTLFKSSFEKLPARLREALYLKTYEGLSYLEIANIMEVTPQVARNYIHRALKLLRDVMSQS